MMGGPLEALIFRLVTNMTSIADNLESVRRCIVEAATAAGRSPQAITLVAVSKTHPPEALREAYEAGQRHFGESYVQEALPKVDALRDLDGLIWHFIGPLQSNKTRAVAEQFDWVHSVDRLRIAERLSAQRPANRPPLQVCIQLNLNDETSKSGIPASELPALLDAVAALPGLRLRGLMCIPDPHQSPEALQSTFEHLRRLLLEQHPRHPGLDTLSMGMSEDLPQAIAAGSTMVRVGTAIFGQRPAPIRKPT